MTGAIDEYRAALAIDPSYARAAAELAIALSSALIFEPPGLARDAREQERDQATRRALEGAPSSPVALTAKMWMHADRREWVQADEACAAASTDWPARAGRRTRPCLHI